MIARGRALDVLLLLAVASLPLAAAFGGSRSGRPIVLNLGPGDAPYVSGFTPSYEIDDKVATHWTTYHAAISLPLAVEGDGALVYRFARVFPQSAVVEVRVGDAPRDRFESVGGLFVERRTTLGAPSVAPLVVRLDADSHERKDLGLKMDWVRVEPSPEGRVRLLGAARWMPALLLLLVIAVLVSAGFGPGAASALAAPLALALALLLRADPWLAHRLLRGVPAALVLFSIPALAVARWLVARGRVEPASVRRLAVLCVLAFLLRAAAVNHPDFYYPDLRTHARLVETVHEAGWRFFATPSAYIWEHGVWRTEAYGRTYAFPYSPAFHLPFAALALPYDTRIAAMKLAAAALSVVPLILVFALARRVGASTLGAFLMALVPTYTSRLSFAFLPALFGHVVDVAFLLWLAHSLRRVESPRVWTVAAVWVAACQLAYVSGVVNVSLLVAVLAVAAGILARSWRRAALVLGFGVLGSAIAVALYYRDFLPMALDVFARAAAGAARVPSRYPVQSFWSVAYARTRDFFDGVYPVLALAGLLVLWRRRAGGEAREGWPPVLMAWAATYVLLLLGRAKAPDVFLHGHETLLVTPLVCLAAGEALALVGRRGGWGRAAQVILLTFLAVQGLAWQWRALSEQLANAR